MTSSQVLNLLRDYESRNITFIEPDAAWPIECKRAVIAFTGGYHGTGYGTLNTTHREHFRGPFREQLRQFGSFVAFPSPRAGSMTETEHQVGEAFANGNIGAILVEPIQARGGIN